MGGWGRAFLVVACAAACRGQAPETPPVVATLTRTDNAVPRTRTNKYLRRLAGPHLFSEVLPGILLQQLENRPRAWGRSGTALGKRAASQYGQFLINESITAGVGALRGEGINFHRRGQGWMASRISHVLLSGVMTKKNDGSRTIALANLSGSYGSAVLSDLWYPSIHRSGRRMFYRGTLLLTFEVGGNALAEFWPDVKQQFFTKKKKP